MSFAREKVHSIAYLRRFCGSRLNFAIIRFATDNRNVIFLYPGPTECTGRTWNLLPVVPIPQRCLSLKDLLDDVGALNKNEIAYEKAMFICNVICNNLNFLCNLIY